MNNDENNIKKSINLAKQTLEIMADKECKKTIDDYDILSQYCDNEKTDYIKHLTDSDYIKSECEKISNNKVDIDSLYNKLQRAKVVNRRKLLVKYSLSVASAVIAISFSIWAYNNLSSEPYIANNNTIIISDNSELVVDKPTIIFQNGDSLTLDNVNCESIALDSLNKISQTRINKSVAPNSDSVVYNTIIIPKKFNYNVKLSDGSEVVLNACSKLRYPVNFSGDFRKVELEGEAFFKVTKSDKPFIVSTKEMDIKVYGTQFCVNVSRRNSVETVLLEGSVGVTNNIESNSKEMMLKPNQLYSLDKTSHISSVKNVNPNSYISWLDNNFDYSNVTLEFLLEDIAKWYGVEFIVNNNLCKDIYVDIYSNRDDDIDNLINVLQRITNLSFEKISKDKYTIK